MSTTKSSLSRHSRPSSKVTCELCSEFFTDPRLLPCLHAVCYKCLTNDIKSCPFCKKSFKVPKDEFCFLPKDYRKEHEVEIAKCKVKIESNADIPCDRCLDTSSNAFTFCCDCCDFLCNRCTQDHTLHRKMHEHNLVDLGKKQADTMSLLDNVPHKIATCQVHSDEVLKFYCETCEQLVCSDCIILKHSGHRYDRAEEVAEKGRRELQSLIAEALSAADKLQSSASEAGKMVTRVQEKKEYIDELIKSEFKKLHAAIEARENVLLTKNREINFEKEVALKMQLESMKNFQISIQQITSHISEALKVYNPVELLSAHPLMATGLKAINSQFSSFLLESCKTDYMVTSFTTANLISDIQKFSEITGGSTSRNGTVSLLYSSEIIQEEPKTVTITARDANGEPYKYGGENVVVCLSPLDSGGKTSTFTAEDHDDGTYSVTVTPQNTGEHSLDIKIGNESIQSSPFVVYVRKRREFKLENSLQIILSDHPNAVAVSENKLFIVSHEPRIIVADKISGALLDSITYPPEIMENDESNDVVYTSYGIVAQDNILYISDHSLNCVFKLTTDGKYLATIGSPGSGDGQLLQPYGLCLGADSDLFVAEYRGNRVSVFKTDGTFVHHIQGNMNYPWGIAMDPSGNIHVSNYVNAISVYTHEGQFMHQYGEGWLRNPAGIAITAEGFSAVAESYTQTVRNRSSSRQSLSVSKVLMFNTSDLSCVTSAKDIRQGTGVACDKDGRIYVCDYHNRKIMKY